MKVSVTQASRLTKIPYYTLKKLIQIGRLPAVTAENGKILVELKDVEEFKNVPTIKPDENDCWRVVRLSKEQAQKLKKRGITLQTFVELAMRDFERTVEEGSGLTVSQAALILGKSAPTIRRWVDNGILPSFRTAGGQRRIHPEVVKTLATGKIGKKCLVKLTDEEYQTLRKMGYTPTEFIRKKLKKYTQPSLLVLKDGKLKPAAE